METYTDLVNKHAGHYLEVVSAHHARMGEIGAGPLQDIEPGDIGGARAALQATSEQLDTAFADTARAVDRVTNAASTDCCAAAKGDIVVELARSVIMDAISGRPSDRSAKEIMTATDLAASSGIAVYSLSQVIRSVTRNARSAPSTPPEKFWPFVADITCGNAAFASLIRADNDASTYKRLAQGREERSLDVLLAEIRAWTPDGIQGTSLEDPVRTALRAWLDGVISKRTGGVTSESPLTTIQYAASLIKRYGTEGLKHVAGHTLFEYEARAMTLVDGITAPKENLRQHAATLLGQRPDLPAKDGQINIDAFRMQLYEAGLLPNGYTIQSVRPMYSLFINDAQRLGIDNPRFDITGAITVIRLSSGNHGKESTMLRIGAMANIGRLGTTPLGKAYFLMLDTGSLYLVDGIMNAHGHAWSPEPAVPCDVTHYDKVLATLKQKIDNTLFAPPKARSNPNTEPSGPITFGQRLRNLIAGHAITTDPSRPETA